MAIPRMTWTITIPGPPPLWRRPRLARRGRHVAHVTAPATRDDEARVAHCARLHCARNAPIEAPVEVAIDAYFERPARRPACIPADRWATGLAVRRPVRPDKDNIEKAILDGLTRAKVWADDCIADGDHCRRWYCAVGEQPRTVVTVRRVGWLVTECHNVG